MWLGATNRSISPIVLPPPVGDLKWQPGHYSSQTGGSLASWIAAINALPAAYKGVQVFIPWAQLESTQGNYSTADTLLDQLLAAAKAKGCYVSICILEREFGAGFPNTTGDGTVPSYLGSLSGAAGGWYPWTGTPITFSSISGTSGQLASSWPNASGTQPLRFSDGTIKTGTFTSGSTNVTWSGSVSGVSLTAGWGNTTWSGGLRFMAKLDNTTVFAAYQNLWRHIILRYESALTSQYSEQLIMMETDETAVGVPAFDTSTWNSNLLGLFSATRALTGRMGFRLNCNFFNPSGFFDTAYPATLAHLWFDGGPDPEIPPGPGPYTRPITSNTYFRGEAGSSGNQRGIIPWCGEQQELGYNRGYTPAQSGGYQITTMRCSYMFWVSYTVNYTGGSITPADTLAYIQSIGSAVGISTKPPAYN